MGAFRLRLMLCISDCFPVGQHNGLCFCSGPDTTGEHADYCPFRIHELVLATLGRVWDEMRCDEIDTIEDLQALRIYLDASPDESVGKAAAKVIDGLTLAGARAYQNGLNAAGLTITDDVKSALLLARSALEDMRESSEFNTGGLQGFALDAIDTVLTPRKEL